MVRIDRRGEARQGALHARALLEPARVHPVTGAVDVAASDAFVRLHEVEAAARELAAGRARERPVAPEAADVEGLDEDRRAVVVGPAARDEREAGAAAAEGRVDDTPEVIANRLRHYHEDTEPVVERYADAGMLLTVDGERSVDEVAAEIDDALAAVRAASS